MKRLKSSYNTLYYLLVLQPTRDIFRRHTVLFKLGGMYLPQDLGTLVFEVDG